MKEDETKKIFAENLNQLMTLHGKVQNDIINDLNIKQTTLSDWINGKKFPRIDKIELLSNYFGVKKSDLIERRTHTQDEKDVATIIEEMRERLTRNDLTFEGKPVTPEDIQSILSALQVGMEMARKQINEKK